MPAYDYVCPACQKEIEVIRPMLHDPPACCGQAMNRKWSVDYFKISFGYPAWIDRIDDIHKSQEQKGERLRMVHPREVGAT